MRWTDRAVRAALGLGPGDDGLEFSSIVTDTRTLERGSLFVALSGDRFDGHAFLDQAREAGALGAVVRTGTPPVPGLRSYDVADPLHGYGLLARYRRRTLAGPVVAVTGTNGKTSTKEMLAAALATRFRVHATRKNLNNLVGVPQTILEAPDDTEALVVEAGANLPGEIARYREIIEPSITVITNVAAGHLEGFGSLDGVRREKLSLAAGVPVAIIGGADPAVAAGARLLAHRVVTAGLAPADVAPTAVVLRPDGRPEVTFDGMSFVVGQLGLHQAANAALAWAVGRELALDPRAVARALEAVTIPDGRGQLTRLGGLTVLNDSYNANPASFEALIDLVTRIRDARRLVFVVGTMRELGPDADRFHAEIAARLAALEPDLLAAVGDFGPALAPYRDRLGNRLITAPDAVTMAEALGPRLVGDELVVLKGSRGVALERIIPTLTSRIAH